ncbi:DUF4232 domain-containing protein [Streptomyces broussonetiae]|uniref:DUF4232 domain-containing protein n=1 Tax=Streptomyces broussonetiae TaxID=2686304 RepID=A0A6I6NLA2_9ACTN|nr:DUF4232 domain-containing protein [Streptomyces broussonetiae]
MRHIRLYAVTGTALTALALTACAGGGTGTKDEGAAGPRPTTAATATADRTATPGVPGGAPGATNTAGAPKATTVSARTSATKPGKHAAAALQPCNGSNTKVTATPVSRPLNHLLLTATNVSGRRCDLMYWPTPRFDDAQWAPEVIKDSEPQAVVSLEPGQSGYAGVRLSAADGSGENGTTAHKLEVLFLGRTPDTDSGPSAHPVLPAKGVYYDSTLAMTYWQQDRSDALSW